MNAQSEEAKTRAHILVVEDSATQAAHLKHVLEEQGYLLSTALNGEEALAAVREHAPSLVISDIIMPEMDGYQLCGRMKQDDRLKQIPVILLTSLTDPVDVVKGLECGADNFIVKPFEETYLTDRIASMLAHPHCGQSEDLDSGVEIDFAGQQFLITSDRMQILNLLLSTYDVAVHRNRELIEAQSQLRRLNDQLESLVRERTASLESEIKERRRAEAEVRQLNADLERRVLERTAQLEAANKELEAFSYSVSHDLRAPLRHVHGYAEILKDTARGGLSEEAQRSLQVILDASAEMGRLIDGLLALSRMSRGGMDESRVPMDGLVKEAIGGLEMEVKDRNIVWKITALPPVLGDSMMLKQVLANLIGNAIKYTGPRDPAEIEIGQAGLEEGRVVLFVRDNGVGFNMDYAGKLFGAFQRLHRAEEFEGTGIGLATVRRIIARHGGRTWAQSRPDEGATFFFTLKPLDPPSQE